MKDNKVIIICDNHHNGLGLVRSFGRCGVKPDGIIIASNIRDEFVSKSKYWNVTRICRSPQEIIKILLEEYEKQEKKPVLIPCSDTIAMILDSNVSLLAKKYIFPTINSEQGKIVSLMDKEYQVEFCKQYHIPIAKSWVIKKNNVKEMLAEIPCPCIVKPVSSYEGLKTDIKKCNDKKQLSEYLSVIFGKRNYNRILVQEYIDFEYEIEFIGGYHNDDAAYIISKTHRGWPIVGGTNSFFQVVNNININKVCEDILSVFREIRFSGLFDIEMFLFNGKIYMNEINWRNTGNSFFCKGTGVEYAVVWYLSVIGKDASSLKHTCTDVSQYALNEATDFRHVLFNHYSVFRWNKERKNTNSFALWDREDKKPAIARYKYLLKKLIKM